MKGLIKTIFIIMAIIAIGIVAIIVMTTNLNRKVAAAQGDGVEKGSVYGYDAGFQEGGVAGFQDGSKTGYVRSSGNLTTDSYGAGFYFSYNPTYDEVLKLFAEKDNTSAREINNYAEANGMRAAYVRVQIARPAEEGMVWVYRLVAFETVDKGFVIVEPGSHKVVKVAVGKRFRELNGFPTLLYDDTITKISIIW